MKNNQNKKTRFKILFLVMTLLFSLNLSACGEKKVKTDEIKDPTAVFTYGEEAVSKGEVYIYVNTIKERYETQYGEDVWDIALPQSENSEEQLTMVDFTKEEVVNEIVRVKTLYAQAENMGVFLTEEQKQEILDEAQSFYDGLTDVDIESLELTVDIVNKVMVENKIAKLVQDKLLEDNPIEISDEEARMTTFYDMYFNCYSIDENGVMVPYTEEQCNIQYENALTACSTLATAVIDENSDAENIENLAAYYKLDYAAEYTISPEEIMNIYGEDIYNTLYSMENGDYSSVIKSEYGYHVFQMVALTDKKATQSKKDIMTKAAIEEYLRETLNGWQKEIDPEFSYPESINMDVYNTITIE